MMGVTILAGLKGSELDVWGLQSADQKSVFQRGLFFFFFRKDKRALDRTSVKGGNEVKKTNFCFRSPKDCD